ncbi:carboxylesterase/lipase family protein [Adhaeribacter rhizoryzae]|uniref:Carboxylic ester hydrolase n=1 Tax=Adhaeribacter rhizoryzae TaxID=2607907 RepID=A0A5M6DTP5_9BACT|nr:carboxylesterase family protein [Adhaeribacter rhizoryzae]KAA5548805.1 carboxylesterase family protein [Adhaeribacter rhizoryzae]
MYLLPKLYTCLLLIIFKAFLPGYSQDKTQNTSKTLTNEVKVTGGIISGSQASTGIRAYKGIPFAAPPVGELRWQAPQPVKPWSGVRSCTVFGPSPMQREPAPFSMWSAEFLIQKEPISEDCLYLNVWTGAKTAGEKRPVIVWIYGGGFNSGGTNVPIYDGEAMARKGVVFVSVNYRVGIFGFFAHPELTKESGRNASGNYGLLDQVAGLRWVQQNISAFGGDPQNVTISGQSAGSMSVNLLVASPLAKNLFTKAIAQSGASFTRKSLSLAQAEQEGLKMAEKLNASTLAQLRKMPANELQQKGQGSRPIVDGYFLPDDVAAIFAAGKANKVALLTGWNENEGLSGQIKSAAEFRQQVEAEYGTAAKTFLQYYPATNDKEAEFSQQNLSRDLTFGLQNYTWANVQAQQGKLPVYVYRFARIVPATGEYKKYGAFHTGEVPYAYNNLKFVDRPWEPADHQLANIMSSYWVNFATKGNPNGPGLPEWPSYTLTGKKIMVLDTKLQAKPIPDKAALDFLYKATVKN